MAFLIPFVWIAILHPGVKQCVLMRVRLHTVSFVCALLRNRIPNCSLYCVFELFPAAVSQHHRSAIVRTVTSQFTFANMPHAPELNACASQHRGYIFHARGDSYLASSETEPQALLPHYNNEYSYISYLFFSRLERITQLRHNSL
jgi:hypothetical protein